jgi:hypothetical protein
VAAKVKNLTYASDYKTYWDAQPKDADTNYVNSGAAVLGATRLICSYVRATPAGTREDRAVFGVWCAKIVGGGLYSRHDISELAGLETAADAFTTALKAFMSTSWQLVEYAWFFVTQDSPRDDSGRSQLMGPPARITSKSVFGSGGTQSLPHQCASTITLRTASRRHWGRSYIPGLSVGQVDAQYGRLTTTCTDGLASAMNTLHNTWQDAGTQLGTYSLLKPAFLTPKQIEVDDIFDIVRRRRAKQSAYKKLLS